MSTFCNDGSAKRNKRTMPSQALLRYTQTNLSFTMIFFRFLEQYNATKQHNDNFRT